MPEAHVIIDERNNLGCVVVGEPQAFTDFFRDLDVHLHMIIETDSIGRYAERGRLSNVVEQRTPSERWGTRLRQILQQQQSMNEDVALGMKLGRLLDSFHPRDFR